MKKNNKIQVTIIGFGTMGQAIAKSLLSHDKNIKISVVRRGGNLKNLFQADFVVLAVKPKDIKEIAVRIKNKIGEKSIIISILAGTNIKTISRLLNSNKIVRIMPNLGLSVGAGIAVWKKGNGFTPQEYSAVKKFIYMICENIETKNERMIDAATAISGSGPAYFFFLAEAMFKAARSLKLDEKTARHLVSKTLFASALLQNNTDYKVLIDKIASRGGTTEAALEIFKKQNFAKIVDKAVKAANKRAIQISQNK
jgi:pyrroline-5-carboxylate reductase